MRSGDTGYFTSYQIPLSPGVEATRAITSGRGQLQLSTPRSYRIQACSLSGRISPMNGLYDGEFVGFKITSPEELATALREAVIAIDANVLLDLYRFRPQTSRDLIKTLKSLEDRLVVPHQALREFWRHRQRSHGSPRGARKAATDALAKSGRSMCDALAAWGKAVGVDDEELSDLTARVDDFLDALKGELQQVLQDADAERVGDPILEQLEELLAGRVTSPLDHDEWTECVAEANRRIEAEDPPGYRDAEKQESGSPEGGAGTISLVSDISGGRVSR